MNMIISKNREICNEMLVAVVVVVLSPIVGPGIISGMPLVEVFLRDPNPIYASFGENHGKLQTTSMTGN